MKKSQTEPLRGQAAYRAHLQEVARSNEIAQAAAMRRRDAKEAVVMGEAAERARREMRDLHRQEDR
ncbi:hypothetical protein DVA67_007080 [Solirubrobacter sp. CPCC 204708]|uniref:Uncharacterized protein n=1 Tax=Solirubrobacter deserti TaxID=2282478 RepID=A0ABT4RP85_9ACTN|nr:hypothetical protein [Solirubrobacter deserti]MBE2315732.1 hypothetical protein [Solirubrobacter deserti]MDA0140378.1 hypothetical protein [Solirubrobacter deserti]